MRTSFACPNPTMGAADVAVGQRWQRAFGDDRTTVYRVLDVRPGVIGSHGTTVVLVAAGLADEHVDIGALLAVWSCVQRAPIGVDMSEGGR